MTQMVDMTLRRCFLTYEQDSKHAISLKLDDKNNFDVKNNLIEKNVAGCKNCGPGKCQDDVNSVLHFFKISLNPYLKHIK